jgi:hypothetical protein
MVALTNYTNNQYMLVRIHIFIFKFFSFYVFFLLEDDEQDNEDFIIGLDIHLHFIFSLISCFSLFIIINFIYL